MHLGGMTSSGLSWTDAGRTGAVGGIAREFYRRIRRRYDDDVDRRPSSSRGYYGYIDNSTTEYYDDDDDAMWAFEPRVAEAVFEEMIREHRSNIRVAYGERLDRISGGGGVRTDGEKRRIVSLRTVTATNNNANESSSPSSSYSYYYGSVFIDASYEGDAMAGAGVSYLVGRESNAVYNETVDGVAKRLNTHRHRFVGKVDPYVSPGDPDSGTLPGINEDGARLPVEDGSGDRRVQAYCYRMCVSKAPENRIPFAKPDGYDEASYELLFRNFEAGDARLPVKLSELPNGKADLNNQGAVSTDYVGMNYDYPDASCDRRNELAQQHETYQRGLMWTLANHARVPPAVRREMSKWGLAADEFVDNDNWPRQLYVREARRMIGEYVMTERDCRGITAVDDSIGMGSYNMDSHNVQRYVTDDGFVQNEGDVQISSGGTYKISYRSVVPRRAEIQNLLVPVCLSASHIAYGSVRMEPVFMILGQSAGAAACLAIEQSYNGSGNNNSGTPGEPDLVIVQDVPYSKLRTRLLADGQALDDNSTTLRTEAA